MGSEELSQRVLEAARAKAIMLTTAESCTGGMIAAALTAIPGSSDVFERGFVTYSNAAKRDMLGVTQTSLDQYGAVSEQVACEMATGAVAHSAAGLAVSVTGIAGPGGSDVKPEGLVCFAVSARAGETVSQTIEFGALGRQAVREAATRYALTLLLETLTTP